MLIGVTGTYGSGKSTVARMMAEAGAAVIDADLLAREAVAPGSPALDEIRQRFGAEYIGPDGALDRRKMAERVFGAREERGALEAIIHPRVGERMRERVAALQDEARAAGACEPIIALVVPLLYEAGLDRMVEQVAVVTVSVAERYRRVRGRDGLTERQLTERLAAQWPQREKARRADYVIENSGSLGATEDQVREMMERLRARRTSPARDKYPKASQIKEE